MEFSSLPPEINSGLIYSGPGEGPLMAAASAWSLVAQELEQSATEIANLQLGLTSTWTGPSSVVMQTTVGQFVAWLRATQSAAATTGLAATQAAMAYSAARSASATPAEVLNNRLMYLWLVATNLLGQNSAAIAAVEADYMRMWAQDAVAMDTYQASAQTATSQLQPFTPPMSNAAPGSTGVSSAASNTVMPTPMSMNPAATTVTLPTWLDNLLNGLTGGTVGPNAPLMTYLGALVDSNGLNSLATGDFMMGSLVGLLSMLLGLGGVEAAVAGAASQPAPVTQVFPPSYYAPPTQPSADVVASRGDALRVGPLSVPNWATAPEPGKSIVRVTTPTATRMSAGIPILPAPVVTGRGGGAGRHSREQPEYGEQLKVMPKRHPSGG